MSELLPGELLLDVVRSARESVILAAPYIKLGTLERVAAEIRAPVLTCITRWLPVDVASGVSDLEVLDLIRGLAGAKLLVHPHIHAKYYRGDQRCLVGSANLTGRGLGWVTPANAELLVEVRQNELEHWERELVSESIPATDALREKLRNEADQLAASTWKLAIPEADSRQTEDATAPWIPLCPRPDRLWDVYEDRGEETMVTSAWSAGVQDLERLRLPRGLTRDAFYAYIVAALKRVDLVREVDRLADHGLADSEAQAFLEERLGSKAPYPSTEMWRVLKAWLVHFLGETYRLEVGQEVFVKGRDLSG